MNESAKRLGFALWLAVVGVVQAQEFECTETICKITTPFDVTYQFEVGADKKQSDHQTIYATVMHQNTRLFSGELFSPESYPFVRGMDKHNLGMSRKDLLETDGSKELNLDLRFGLSATLTYTVSHADTAREIVIDGLCVQNDPTKNQVRKTNSRIYWLEIVEIAPETDSLVKLHVLGISGEEKGFLYEDDLFGPAALAYVSILDDISFEQVEDARNLEEAAVEGGKKTGTATDYLPAHLELSKLSLYDKKRRHKINLVPVDDTSCWTILCDVNFVAKASNSPIGLPYYRDIVFVD